MSRTGKVGLVLTGGGARSAYQAGVLLGLSRLLTERRLSPLQFPVICGISGGAINGSYLASRVTEMPTALEELCASWRGIRLEDVFDTRSLKIFGTATHLALQLGLGGLLNGNPVTQLLDTGPLVGYLKARINFDNIRRNISSGHLHGLALTATNYGTGSTVTFFDGANSINSWMRSHRIGIRAKLSLKHLLASAAIPMLFPPVKVNGSFFGDGAVRMASPLSPAIHLGADRVLAVGVRYHRTPAETFEMNQAFQMKTVQLADISGVLLNSLFMNALDSDLERMARINQTLEMMPKTKVAEHPEKLRRIPVLAIRPSKDLGKLAVDEFKRFSWVLRHFIHGLGASEHHGSDLMSYLAFEHTYTSRLLDLGVHDVKAEEDRIVHWLRET